MRIYFNLYKSNLTHASFNTCVYDFKYFNFITYFNLMQLEKRKVRFRVRVILLLAQTNSKQFKRQILFVELHNARLRTENFTTLL